MTLYTRVAGIFSDYFSRLNGTSQKTLRYPAFPGHSTSFILEPFTREDVAKASARLDTKKATGLDSISAGMLKTTAPYICDSLCNLFNSSVRVSQMISLLNGKQPTSFLFPRQLNENYRGLSPHFHPPSCRKGF